jgi:hypothetical protein
MPQPRGRKLIGYLSGLAGLDWRRREHGGCALPDEGRDARELGGDLCAAKLVRARANDDHRIDSGREEVGLLPEGLADQALRAVSLDGSPDFPRRHNAEARRSAVAAATSREENQEMPRSDARAALLNADKVRALADALGSREFRAGEGDGAATSCRWW